ncbi:hypothetical protein CDG81_19370 [Actinopolyspora erythraea]|uniref:Serine/threonine protein kinase n=1 Tax=Actinopolyspora erythraea TaxID=414996 RepID=A0A099D8E8_9ACTN|nr:hypothetical protein [Actinopolyspora erythraea]ASU80062.1 hypothetical protein CDG81_19370 [Actinopolyspora erythraea]KGI82206.1 hypothetical protein IL38_05520 [Actinopolyspora erythraea]
MDGGNPNGWSDGFEETTREPAAGGGRERRSVTGPNRATVSNATGTATTRHRQAEPVSGLCEFDLGMVPASITPPRTWRRAAWFVVLSAVVALSGIVLGTTVVMNRTPERFVAEPPRMPRGGEYPPLSDQRGPASGTESGGGRESTAGGEAAPTPPVTGTTRRWSARPDTGVVAVSGRREPASPERTGPVPPEPTGGTSSTHGASPDSTAQGTPPSNAPQPSGTPSNDAPPDEAAPSVTAWNATPQISTEPQTSTEPSRSHGTTFPLAGIREVTEDYFTALGSGEPHEAYGMTGGVLRGTGPAGLERRYGHFWSVELVSSTVRGDSTVNELRVSEANGRSSTCYRRLEFDATGGRVTADEAVDELPGNR